VPTETAKFLIQPPADLPRAFALEYLEECLRELPLLKAAADASNFMRARSFGHQMKGNGKPYGFPVLSRMGLAIELAADRADPVDLIKQVTALEEYLSQVELA